MERGMPIHLKLEHLTVELEDGFLLTQEKEITLGKLLMLTIGITPSIQLIIWVWETRLELLRLIIIQV
jgi:hypothetical protein